MHVSARLCAAFLLVSAAACSSSTSPSDPLKGVQATTRLNASAVSSGVPWTAALVLHNSTSQDIMLDIESTCALVQMSNAATGAVVPIPINDQCRNGFIGGFPGGMSVDVPVQDSLTIGPMTVGVMAPTARYLVATCAVRTDGRQPDCTPAVPLSITP